MLGRPFQLDGVASGRGRRTLPLSALAAAAVAAACGGATVGSLGAAPGTPSIASFTASPSTVASGGGATLSWSVSGATALSIDHGVGPVTGDSASVNPTSTTTYTLTATNGAGPVTAQVKVNVASAAVPVIASFTASPSTIAPGESATLSWSVSGATALSIDHGVGAVAGTSTSVKPASTTTYILTATNGAGNVTAATAVAVNGSSGPRPSPGCGLAGSAGYQVLGMTINGTARSYGVQVPTPYAPSTPLPLVFYFHWLGGTIDDARSNDGAAIWNVVGAASSAVFVWPQGLTDNSGQTGWYGGFSCTDYDVAFFDAMVTAIGNTRCIDLNRVFSAGFSFGTDMTNRLACCRGDVLRAVVPSSGDDINTSTSCSATATPAVRFSYGTADTAYSQAEFQGLIAWYQGKLGCTTAYDSVSVAPCSTTWTGNSSPVSCSCKSYRGCARPMIACEFLNMPHTIPDGWRDDAWAFISSFK